MKAIDDFLNSITMYRLVLYGLAILALLAVTLGFIGTLPYGGFALLAALLILTGACFLFNRLCASFFGVYENTESSLITGLILFFIFEPSATPSGGLFLAGVAAVAMASKYVIVFRKKLLFNPAAFAAVVFGLGGSFAAVWWVGSTLLFVPVAILGLFVVRKVRRAVLFFSFLLAALAVLLTIGFFAGAPLLELLRLVFLSWPLVFFASIMLTEPATTPPTREGQVAYGIVVGALFSAQFNFGPIHATPELALVAGNIFAYALSYKARFRLMFQCQRLLSPSIREFIFKSDRAPEFSPGQYMEWTIKPERSDDRGNRRYFTIASSPTEADIHLGIRYSEPSSAFKQRLAEARAGDYIFAGQVMGDFVLPADPSLPLLWIAGGIGVTPFRSMARYMIDTERRLDAVLVYVCVSSEDFAYADIFSQAEAFGLRTIYLETGSSGKPFDPARLADMVPDYTKRLIYISGPNGMVAAYKKSLRQLGVHPSRLMTDYFPGF